MDARDRGRLMNKLADLIEAHIDELAELETLDNGKPISESRHGDLPLVIDCLRYYAGWADKIHGKTIPVRGRYFCYTRREPVGVVGQIIPWNFPMLMVAWKWGPALAAGCTVVLKPAEQTPLSALRMGELAHGGRLSRRRHQHRPRLRRDRRRRPGQAHGRRQGRLHRRRPTSARSSWRTPPSTLKRVTLELGGKSPNIVFADADLDAAVDGAMLGLFLNQGQCCCAGSRLFVEEKVYDKLVEQLAARRQDAQARRPLRRRRPSRARRSTRPSSTRSSATSSRASSRGPRCVSGGERFGIEGLLHQADRLRRRQGRHEDRHARRSSAR